MNEAKLGFRMRWRLSLAIANGAVAVLALADTLTSWQSDSWLSRAIQLFIGLSFGWSAVDYAQRRIVFTPDSIRVRYLFLWKEYPIPPNAEVQDWGHSIGFIDPISYRPLYILPKSSVPRGVGLPEVRAARKGAQA